MRRSRVCGSVAEQGGLAGFRNDEQALLAALQFIDARFAAGGDSWRDPLVRDFQRKKAARRAREWHRSAELSGKSSRLCAALLDEKLTRIERELVLLCVLRELHLSPARLRDFGDALKYLCLPPRELLRLGRSLASGRLSRSALLLAAAADEHPDALPEASPLVLNLALGRRSRDAQLRVRHEDELAPLLGSLAVACREQAEALAEISRGSRLYARRLRQLQRRSRILLGQLEQALQAHPRWFLAPVFRELQSAGQRLVVLLLAARELDLLEDESALWSGTGLSRAVCLEAEDSGTGLRLLRPRGRLLREGWVRPACGEATHCSNSAAALGRSEFELGEHALLLLKLESRRSGKTRLGLLLEPRIPLSRIVLPDEARDSLQLGLAQLRHERLLLRDWGLKQHIPYGTGVCMLFYGPPGTGKTAAAEALAHELGRRLLAVDVSKLQSCYVGNTEKNIAHAFELARRNSAVLFWDEADALLYDRNLASRSWELSQVSLLLGELERFDGVCILASNRKSAMDPALERRIALRIEFSRPGREIREKLWNILLPPSLPLEKGVELQRLAEHELSGGQIKNVILNAARRACQREEHRALSLADFEQAIELELHRSLQHGCKQRIGFAAH